MYFCFECFTRPYCLLRHQYFSYVTVTYKPMGFKQGAIRLADTIRIWDSNKEQSDSQTLFGYGIQTRSNPTRRHYSDMGFKQGAI